MQNQVIMRVKDCFISRITHDNLINNECLIVKLVPSWSNPIKSLSYACSASWKTLCSCNSSGCAKTYVRWSRMGRNLVQTCKPLTWLVYGTSTFLIRKNTGTIENWLQITVELKFILVIKANLMLDEMRSNIPFNFAILQPFHLFFWS